MDVPIRDESIRLGQFLKLANLIESGSEAKPLVAEGAVQVNGEVETRRGRQLVRGDVVTLAGQSARVADEGSPTTCRGEPPLVQSVSQLGQLTPIRSTTKTSVSPGLMTPPAPRSPYPRCGGITSWRRPPTFMPWTPWSQPEMT